MIRHILKYISIYDQCSNDQKFSGKLVQLVQSSVQVNDLSVFNVVHYSVDAHLFSVFPFVLNERQAGYI